MSIHFLDNQIFTNGNKLSPQNLVGFNMVFLHVGKVQSAHRKRNDLDSKMFHCSYVTKTIS